MAVKGFCKPAHQICRDSEKRCGDCIARQRRVEQGLAEPIVSEAEAKILPNGLPSDFFLSEAGKRRLALRRAE